MPGTNRIAWGSGVAPSTDFYLDADVVGIEWYGQGPNTPGRWLIHAYLTAVNRGSTGSFDNGTGTQQGYKNGEWFGQHGGTPFLPSGVPTNGTRWVEGPFAFYVDANSSGYWSGTSESFQLGMVVSCPSFNSGNLYGSITLPRIAQPAPAPTPIGVDQATQTSLRYRFSSNGDGGSPIVRWEYQYSTSSNFSSGNSAIFSHPTSGVHTVTGLNPRTKYYFRSRGINEYTGAWSSIVNGDTVDVPDAPSLTAGTKTSTSITPVRADGSYTGGTITARETQISRYSDFSTVLSTASGTSPSFTGLLRATAHYLRSRSTNAVGNSAWSPTLAVTTDTDLPSAPSGTGVTDLASTTAYTILPSVADNGGASLSDLRAQVNTSQSESGATLFTAGGFRPAFLSGLTPGTVYWMRLAVANSAGWGPYGAWFSFTTKSNVPTPPQTFASSGVGNTVATLSWTAPANLHGTTVLSYTVRLATDPGFGLNLVTHTVAGSPLALDGLLEGTTYYAQVWANTPNGVGSYSSVISFTTTGAPPVPQPVWMRIAGAWEPGVLWMKVLGVGWRQGTLWQRIAGFWRS